MVKIRREVYEAIKEAFLSRVPECGGVLGALPGEPISQFYFDMRGKGTPDSYTPDYEGINALLENEWAKDGVYMVGMIHSHGNAGDFPSCGDLYYCEQIMKSAGIGIFLLPIVTLQPFEIHMYAVLYREDRIYVKKEEINII